MAIVRQFRDYTTGDARTVEVDATTHDLAVMSADGATQLAVFQPRTTVVVAGQYRLSDDQISGYGTVGPVDDSNTQNLGASAATNLSRNAGGWTFPFAVNLLRFYVPHRNNNASAAAWGWTIYHMNKLYDGSNTRSTTFVVDEVGDNAGVGPNDYGSNNNMLTDIDLSAVTAAQNIPAGNVIGVAVNAPTSPADYFVQCFGGYIELERA